MTDPRGARESLKTSERGWLRAIDGALDLDDRRLEAVFPPAQLRVARAAYTLLVR